VEVEVEMGLLLLLKAALEYLVKEILVEILHLQLQTIMLVAVVAQEL
tara:strand:- start:1132 stop:1272 length:141 start_codon:yes stop_codon:yes gene_type:complete